VNEALFAPVHRAIDVLPEPRYKPPILIDRNFWAIGKPLVAFMLFRFV